MVPRFTLLTDEDITVETTVACIVGYSSQMKKGVCMRGYHDNK